MALKVSTFDIFSAILGARSFFPKKNPALSHNFILASKVITKFTKKSMTQFQENSHIDFKKPHAQTLFYTTLQALAEVQLNQ